MASHRRPAQPGLAQSVRATVLSAAVAASAAGLATPAGAAPGDRSGAAEPTGTVRAQVDTLYEQAERATEKYNAAGERTDTLRRKVAQTTDRVVRGQEHVNRMRRSLGMIATAQYRNGAVDPAIQLLLSSDPDAYLERAATLDRVTGRQAEQLKALLEAQRTLRQERAEATRALAQLEDSRQAVEQHKREVEGKLATARRLLNSMPREDREAYARASRSGGGGRSPVSLAGLTGFSAASGRGAAAAMAARSAVGTPYAWGATGPGAFDCSGLMQWAYGRAGVGLPRTSQAQRNAGRHVSLSEAQPGDLVIYRNDASHVGMYVGNGQVVHAPYPGARVRYDPANMMPISSITRP